MHHLVQCAENGIHGRLTEVIAIATVSGSVLIGRNGYGFAIKILVAALFLKHLLHHV